MLTGERMKRAEAIRIHGAWRGRLQNLDRMFLVYTVFERVAICRGLYNNVWI